VIDDRFSVSRYWTRLSDTRVTFTNLIGSMTALLLGAPEQAAERGHRLRQVLRSGSPDLVREFETRFSVPTTEMYGLTDAGLATAIPPGEAREMSCGPVAPGYEARLVSEGKTVVGAGRGELLIRQKSPGVLPNGYWQGPGEIVPQVDQDGWFATGDDVGRDADGWYYFHGRLKDVIRRSGENISAADVQTAIERHPAVHEVCAFAVPGDLSEDELMVAIELAPGRAVTAEDLRTFVESDLPYFAVPRYFRFVDSLPRNETMKVTTLTLRTAGITEDTIDTGGTSRRDFERRTRERMADAGRRAEP
jgi:crotonobetaine/carnitine-CoA ligase